MKPLIGISGVYLPQEHRLQIANAYLKRTIQAGGIPILLPYFVNENEIKSICSELSALILTGGGDVSPAYYGEALQTEEDRTEPMRDAFELALCAEMTCLHKPMLGICRGAQVLAVSFGEKLLQSVSNHEKGISHEITISKASKLYACLSNERVSVNSFHRQAIAELSAHSPLAVCARSADGVIEAIEHLTLPFCLGVQWHPERLPYESESSGTLFSALVSASKRGFGR